MSSKGPDRKGNKDCRSRNERAKKRKFYGNRYDQDHQVDKVAGIKSASGRKLRTSEEFVPQPALKFLYVLLEFFTVLDRLAELVKCKQCGGDVKFETGDDKGLGFNLKVICSTCPVQRVSSSPVVDRTYEINTRLHFVFRLLGLGYAGLQTFCGLMDMHPPVAESYFQTVGKKIRDVCQLVAERCMRKAVKEELEQTQAEGKFANPTSVAVSVDGSWMRRGFSSLYGIVVIIGLLTGKVLDIFVKSAYCKVCEAWDKKEHNSAEYQEYLNEHWPECAANHDGSAGSMEVTGAVQLFERSIEKHGVMYEHFIGDGDSKTHKAVTEANPYGPTCPVKKKECVGHVGKRMGTRLRNIKKEKKLGGRGGLTGKEIDKLSAYYGNAIRQHPDDAQAMRDAVWATWYHRASTDAKPQHQLCPPGADSWCDWQRAKAAGENLKKFKHKSTLPLAIMEAIKPIYEDLTKPELLDRCLGAHTQNPNESFNSTVWRMAPKSRNSGSVVVETAAHVATCLFNEGHNPLLTIFEELAITVGEHSVEFCSNRDKRRVEDAERRAAAATKEARIDMRRARLAAQDAAMEEEGLLYGPGIA